ncbi:MAG TPA: SDR family NAD(P)-dependent oxidoreductase [Burkholderiales bacterium]|nr:SDR family NAD(P)-dependent oxidoreductase [Burkholderiales bacterium]
MLLKEKVGIVTGAASGMGREAVMLFAEEGARVVCADRDLAGAQKAARQASDTGPDSLALEVNVVAQASTRRVADETVRHFGRIDFLVNYAGVWDPAGIDEIDDAVWDRVLDVNLKGTFFMCQAVAPAMIGQQYGRIVLVGSIAARLGGEMGGPHYAASKGGVISLGRSLARRLGKHHINVNTIDPGATDTPMTSTWSPEVKAMMAKATPTGRIGTPIDMARVAAFLVSDYAGWVSGQTIEVNGGYYFG